MSFGTNRNNSKTIRILEVVMDRFGEVFSPKPTSVSRHISFNLNLWTVLEERLPQILDFDEMTAIAFVYKRHPELESFGDKANYVTTIKKDFSKVPTHINKAIFPEKIQPLLTKIEGLDDVIFLFLREYMYRLHNDDDFSDHLIEKFRDKIKKQ